MSIASVSDGRTREVSRKRLLWVHGSATEMAGGAPFPLSRHPRYLPLFGAKIMAERHAPRDRSLRPTRKTRPRPAQSQALRAIPPSPARMSIKVGCVFDHRSGVVLVVPGRRTVHFTSEACFRFAAPRCIDAAADGRGQVMKAYLWPVDGTTPPPSRWR